MDLTITTITTFYVKVELTTDTLIKIINKLKSPEKSPIYYTLGFSQDNMWEISDKYVGQCEETEYNTIVKIILKSMNKLNMEWLFIISNYLKSMELYIGLSIEQIGQKWANTIDINSEKLITLLKITGKTIEDLNIQTKIM